MADAEVHRAVTHACTTLDVCRRKWRALQTPGRVALTNHVNGRLLLGHADRASVWPKGFAGVRAGVAKRALREQYAAEDALAPVMRDLDKVVSDMRTAADALRTKVSMLLQQRRPTALLSPSLSPHGGGRAATLDAEGARQLVARVDATVRSFETELQLRRTVVRELTGEVGGPDAPHCSAIDGDRLPPGWDASARLLLSAWVLEPHLENDKLDLFFDSMAAEQVGSPARRGSPRT